MAAAGHVPHAVGGDADGGPRQRAAVRRDQGHVRPWMVCRAAVGHRRRLQDTAESFRSELHLEPESSTKPSPRSRRRSRGEVLPAPSCRPSTSFALGKAQTWMSGIADRLAQPAQARLLRRRGWGRRRALDDVQMNSTASRASHGPVFGPRAPANDAQNSQLTLALRAIGPHGRLGFGIIHGRLPASVRRPRIAG